MKYKVGDKVIPIDKTYGMPLFSSSEWNKAKAHGQEYLYVVWILRSDIYALGHNKNAHSGDVFKEEDLVPYVQLTPDAFYKELMEGV